MQVATVGLDLAKSVFQVHGVDARGKVVLAKRLRRGAVLGFFASLPPCTVGMEACASAHYWAREIARFGHTVRLLPPQYTSSRTSSATRTTGLMPRRPARRCSGRPCASSR